MNKIKKIVAPTDLSELSKAGVSYALEAGAALGSEIIVYHVVPYNEAAPYYELEAGFFPPNQIPTVEEILEEHRKQLAKFLAENFADLAAKTKTRLEVVVGIPYQKIVDEATAEKADMIILSTHGRTGLLHALIGSVAEKVVRLAACPVLTVRPTKEAAAKSNPAAA